MFDAWQGSSEMANAVGEVVETPTQDMPFKAVIFTEGKVLQERFFETRPEAEAFIVDTLAELAKTDALETRLD
jgi:O-acetyl-ADP-ribose deacetylase (regulator of RNase III)